jgi:hypothetical protein
VAEDKLLFYFAMKKARTYFVLSDFGYRYFRNHGGIAVRRDKNTDKKRSDDLAIVRRVISADNDGWPDKEHFLRRIAK